MLTHTRMRGPMLTHADRVVRSGNLDPIQCYGDNGPIILTPCPYGPITGNLDPIQCYGDSGPIKDLTKISTLNIFQG